jgi:hypothetical protein
MTRKRELPVYVSLEEAAEMMSLSTRTIRQALRTLTAPLVKCVCRRDSHRLRGHAQHERSRVRW